jgi:hypothetical protein
VYAPRAGRPLLPRAFFNASIMPAQTAFVFTDGFLEHFGVQRLSGACTKIAFDAGQGLASLPLGFVAASSGSVPGFTHSWAKTSLCDRRPRLSFCFGPESSRRDHLQIVDGGLYDNLGYKTAFEVAAALAADNRGLKRAMIFIDSVDGEDHQSIRAADTGKYRPIRTLLASTFPNQHSTFTRLRGPMFSSAGFEKQILIDFNAARGFTRADAQHLQQLPALAYFAAHNVSCFKDNGTIWMAPRAVVEPSDFGDPNHHLQTLAARGSDCLSENFARVGYLHKTTYKYDSYFFRLRFELGRLAVKKSQAAILKALAAA